MKKKELKNNNNNSNIITCNYNYRYLVRIASNSIMSLFCLYFKTLCPMRINHTVSDSLWGSDPCIDDP